MKLTRPEELGFSSDRLRRINDYMERYVDAGKIAGFVTLVARYGKVAFFDKSGYQNIEQKIPIELDTIFRIYSMSKPITSVAFMMLFERGLVRLEDPVSKYIPDFKKTKVYGAEGKILDLTREITIHDLLIHTAGLSYGGIEETKIPVDKLYDEADLFNFEIDLEEMVRRIADIPLAYQPGTVWHYSVATDVIGRLIEIISDMPLPEYMDEKIYKPLGMVDTAFHVPPEKVKRFSTLYGKSGNSDLDVLEDVIGGNYFKVNLFCGGSGLVSTTLDYLRFA
ncbi:beta-lactamase family protein, partial [bacterium]|nr:beta-lactamase family protein [bacterium]